MTLPIPRPERKTKSRRADRSVFLVFPPIEKSAGVFQVTERTPKTEKVTDYLFTPIPCDWNGLGYRVEKLGTEPSDGPYTVCLDAERGLDGQHSCECKGHLAHGHCVHVSALLALHQSGQLNSNTPPDPSPVAETDDEEPPF
jgi:hypothetical protein